MSKKPSKALRGKRRWIGCEYEDFETRKELEDYLSVIPVKLYDMDNGRCVISVSLGNYEYVKHKLARGQVVSITSSGKIKLVRERLGLAKRVRKR